MEDSHTTPISKVLWPVHISASLKRRATLVMLQVRIDFTSISSDASGED